MPDSLKQLGLLFGLLCGLPLLHAALTAPRNWAANETPIAFWAWRTEAPTPDDLRRSNATRLFLRAGQFDLAQGEARRIRAVEGAIPRGIEIHLVYNATRDLLAALDTIESTALAAAIADTYRADAARAARDGACVTGLQLDLDAPTRLLPRYAELLRLLRAQLQSGSAGARLSITGLPTWMDSPHLHRLLDEVDFWTPQFYGWEIPERLEKRTPISSPEAVRYAAARARDLDRPFYAGLAAYSYAVLYSAEGKLVEVRGDLDPALVANSAQLELIESQPFDNRAAAEWRHVYRARADTVLDGLVVRRGEQLMLDTPSAATLRASARAVREEAGERLLGLCVFRLPSADDPATLGAAEIAAALADREATIATEVHVRRAEASQWTIRAANTGTAAARLGDGALGIELRIAPGSLRDVQPLTGAIGVATSCDAPLDGAPRPCSVRRASRVRIAALAWPPGATAEARLDFATDPPVSIPAQITMRAGDGRVWQATEEIKEPRQ
jgi:hypothetical protein